MYDFDAGETEWGTATVDAFHNPNHPIWGLARIGLVLTALTVTLALSASHFDSTEIQTIGIMFGTVVGAEVLPKFLPKSKGGE